MNHHPGPLIRQIRLARGMSTYALEQVTGLRRVNLSRYERCLQYSLRSLEPLYPIAEALGTSVPALFVMQEIYTATPLQGAELLSTLDRVNSHINSIVEAA